MKKRSRNTDESLAHVLYQKLGNKWYAFTELDDGDFFMTEVKIKKGRTINDGPITEDLVKELSQDFRKKITRVA